MLLIELALNIMVLVLLAVTIVYCWNLNRRVQILQDGKSELAELLTHFDTSTQRAADSIIALQQASKKIGDTIQARLEKANFIADDLAFMIERGAKLSAELEDGATRKQTASMRENIASAEEAILKARAAVQPASMSASTPSKFRPAIVEVPTESLQKKPEKSEAEPSRAMNSLQAMLERVAARTAPSDPALRGQRSATRSGEARSRSRVEQELLDVIRGGTKA